jgi:hypothetical protein
MTTKLIQDYSEQKLAHAGNKHLQEIGGSVVK